MLRRNQRATILELYEKGLRTRAIQTVMKISRGAIKKVISAKIPDPPNIPTRSCASCAKPSRSPEPMASRRRPRWHQPYRHRRR